MVHSMLGTIGEQLLSEQANFAYDFEKIRRQTWAEWAADGTIIGAPKA